MVESEATIKKQAKLNDLKEKVKDDKVSTVQVKKHSGSMNGKFERRGTGGVPEYLIIKSGIERWLTKHSIEISLQQKREDIIIPKGSPYTPPIHYAESKRCEGCNR